MSSNETPFELSRRQARAIDVGDVQAAAIHDGEEAAYGRELSRDPEENARELAILTENGTPRDSGAWREANHQATLRLMYPVSNIELWLAAARVVDPQSAAEKIAMPFAEACWRFLASRAGEGLDWKHGKTVGLSNRELRLQLLKVSTAANELGRALLGLQSEALRPGHAPTARGARVRSLYHQTSGALIKEMASAAGLNDNEAAVLKSLRPVLDVNGDHYEAHSALLETALLRFGRWCARVYREDGFWTGFPEVEPTKAETRDRFILRLGELWLLGTGARPACTAQTETSKASGFVIFVECVYGHFAGLAEGRMGRDRAVEYLVALGLDRAPTARTLSKILKPAEIDSSRSASPIR